MKRTYQFLIICSLFLLLSSCFTTKKAVEPESDPIQEAEAVSKATSLAETTQDNTEMVVDGMLEEILEEVIVIPPSLYADNDMWLALHDEDEPKKGIDVFYLIPPDFSEDAYRVIDGELDYLYDNEEEELIEEPTEGEDEVLAEIEEKTNPLYERWPYYYSAQALIFDEDCNLYSPLYTPVNPIAYVDASEAQRENLLRKEVLPDITEAFTYYLEHYNEGRPFILASSSEGAGALLLLMKDLFDNEEIASKLIAAYLPGTSVTERDLASYPHLKFTEQPDDTGVIVSWNTEGEKILVNNPFVYEDTLVINPTTWTYTEEFISKTKNKGAIFFDNEGKKIIDIRKFTSTQIDPLRRVVVAYDPDAGFYLIWEGQRIPRGVYHLQDYTFFYQNIRMNVKERIASYLDN